MSVDPDLNKYLGLSEGHRLDKDKAFGLCSYLWGLTGNSGECEITPIVLMLYVDKNGDFTTIKTKRNLLVKEIFENMSKDDQFEILNYMDSVKK